MQIEVFHRPDYSPILNPDERLIAEPRHVVGVTSWHPTGKVAGRSDQHTPRTAHKPERYGVLSVIHALSYVA